MLSSESSFIPLCIWEAELEISCSQTGRLCCAASGRGARLNPNAAPPPPMLGHLTLLKVVTRGAPGVMSSEETGQRRGEFNNFSNYSSVQNLLICHLLGVGVTQLNTNISCQDRGGGLRSTDFI